VAEEVELSDDVRVTILEAVRERIANLSVLAALTEATDLYSKGPPGDNYSKNKAAIDFGGERVLPVSVREALSGERH
jgi:hypothetical protein